MFKNNDLQIRYHNTPQNSAQIATLNGLHSRFVPCTVVSNQISKRYPPEMVSLIPPILATLALMITATVVGVPAVVKLIKVREAKHELKHGSAGFIRSVAGWAMIAFWLMATWFVATIIGDWGVSGDLDGAIDRSWLRLRILLEIAAALGDSN